jgi:hypothetical protein
VDAGGGCAPDNTRLIASCVVVTVTHVQHQSAPLPRLRLPLCHLIRGSCERHSVLGRYGAACMNIVLLPLPLLQNNRPLAHPQRQSDVGSWRWW